ncbi:unnamed protein product, partial [Symbiodinium necroappetens]
VPAIIVDCRVKKVKAFHKMVGFAIDRERGGMWFEAIGSLPVLQALADRMNRGKLVMFSKLCIKKSAYHSGGRYLDLSAKSGATVSGLPPVHAAYKDLQEALRDGYACNSKIALLEGMRRGQKADVIGKVIDVTLKSLKDGNEKGEVWLKDDSDRRVLCEMWGSTFAALLKDVPVGKVVRILNFGVITHDGKSISLSGEFFGDSERGSAMVEVVLAGEQAERLASVEEEGGESMSMPWTAQGSSKMSFAGTCFVSCLASVKNCPLVPSTAGTMDSQGSEAASQSRTYAKEALKEEIRVFVPGVWLTDVRDQDPVFYVCENSHLKIDGSTGLCRKSGEGCQCKASADPILLTSVTLADFS